MYIGLGVVGLFNPIWNEWHQWKYPELLHDRVCNKISYLGLVKFTTKDTKVKNTNITTIYKDN